MARHWVQNGSNIGSGARASALVSTSAKTPWDESGQVLLGKCPPHPLDAHNNPQFYRQLGKNPELLVAKRAGVLEKRLNCSCACPPMGLSVHVSFHQLRTYRGTGLGPRCADIVAKVPNCPAPIFLLQKNPTDDP
jgi:hypothetical protein